MSDHVSVRISLLDKQIVDCERLAIGRVDDLELSLPSEEQPARVEAILTGAEALGERLGGTVGRWMAATTRLLRPPSAHEGPTAIDSSLVAELEPFIRLSVRFDDLPDVAGLERWLARRAVEPLPGATDARE